MGPSVCEPVSTRLPLGTEVAPRWLLTGSSSPGVGRGGHHRGHRGLLADLSPPGSFLFPPSQPQVTCRSGFRNGRDEGMTSEAVIGGQVLSPTPVTKCSRCFLSGFASRLLLCMY